MSSQLIAECFKQHSNIYADVPVDPQASLGHMASAKKDGAYVWKRAGTEWSEGLRRGGGACVV